VSLALSLSRGIDPTRLAAEIGELDPWQAEVLISAHKRILINCARQSGKSTVGALKALHRAVYRPGALSLIFSPSLRQSREVLLKSIEVYHAIGKPVLAEAENMLSLILENGSRIIALPGSASTVRGYSGVSLIIIDEASYVADELIGAVSPMLAVSQGDLIALSTPHGKRGWWWDAWENGGPSWKRVIASVDKCPRIPKAWLREERQRLGERIFRQEYLCEFIEVVDQAFSVEHVRAAFDRDLEPLRFDEMPEA